MTLGTRQDLAQRVEQVIGALQRLEGARCPGCGESLCGHLSLLNLVLGHQDRPHCLGCLAATVDKDPQVLRDELVAYILGKECLSYGWRWTNLRETGKTQVKPACLWGPGSVEVPLSGRSLGTQQSVTEKAQDGTITVAAFWDAGDLGCGDLVPELRTRLAALHPGQVLVLTAQDPGASEDLPALCRMTGHELVEARHPDYWIRRKA